MRIETLYLFLILAFYSQQSQYSTSSIHQIVNGSMSDDGEFIFVISAVEFKGIILYCFDSERNQFGIEVRQGIKTERLVQIKFNHQTQTAPLRQLCGCDPCEEREVKFDIVWQRGMMTTRCNNHSLESFNVVSRGRGERGRESTDIMQYPMPLAISNSASRLYIRMGNIGPYKGETGGTIQPIKTQLVGCISAFYYNNNPVTFLEDSTSVRFPCPSRCSTDICNGGMCRPFIHIGPTCDCSSTALNGQYCNNTLKLFTPGAHNSYRVIKSGHWFHFKFTWKQLLYLRYCLIDIIAQQSQVTISINKGNLMLDESIISQINMDGTNFINVNITLNDLIVQIKNVSRKFTLSLDSKTRLDVGFSRRNSKCETFAGALDIYSNSTMLHYVEQFQPFTTNIMTDNYVQRNNLTLVNSSSKHLNRPVMILLVSVIAGVFMVLAVLIVVLYQRSRHEMEGQMQALIARSVLSLEQITRVRPESESYGMVIDNSYDYIKETDVYI